MPNIDKSHIQLLARVLAPFPSVCCCSKGKLHGRYLVETHTRLSTAHSKLTTVTYGCAEVSPPGVIGGIDGCRLLPSPPSSDVISLCINRELENYFLFIVSIVAFCFFTPFYTETPSSPSQCCGDASELRNVSYRS